MNRQVELAEHPVAVVRVRKAHIAETDLSPRVFQENCTRIIKQTRGNPAHDLPDLGVAEVGIREPNQMMIGIAPQSVSIWVSITCPW